MDHQPAYTTCKKRGPYYPAGNVDWECLTHGVLLVRVAGEWGTDARRDHMVCPVAFDLDRLHAEYFEEEYVS